MSGFKIAICCKPALCLTIAAVLKVTIYIKKRKQEVKQKKKPNKKKQLVFYPMFSSMPHKLWENGRLI